MSSPLSFFATCPLGLEPLLAEELRGLDAAEVKETRAGVAFAGNLATGYRACLWSRLASRVLLQLATFEATSPEALYDGVRRINWARHLDADGTLAVDANVWDSAITHSRYAALKIKDAVVDQFRESVGQRPSVDTARPDVRVNLHLDRNVATLSLDLAGESLHRRGYRTEAGEAPIKENLAAAILLRAGWPSIAAGGDAQGRASPTWGGEHRTPGPPRRPPGMARGGATPGAVAGSASGPRGTLVDLMCGSGTFLIEAAMIAADIAPGLLRPYFGFLRWKKHDSAAWETLLGHARMRREAGLPRLPPIRGYDADARVIRAARDNIRRAQLEGHIVVEQRELSACTPEPSAPGLVVVNPPYGERLGESPELPALYRELGIQLKKNFPGWRAAVFTGNPELGKAIGIRAHRMHTLWNGAIECKLLHFEVSEQWFMRSRGELPAPATLSGGAEMFANRLRKDLKHFGRWARRQEISCYRLYDADLHEYNLAIDVYDSDKRYVHVQEYEAPETIDPKRARERLAEALAVIPQVVEIPREQMFFKLRRRQKGGAQYEKLAETGEFHEVGEGPCRLLVNFTDYVDTGLFLDHRATRLMLGELANGKRFLNLFCYTASATAHAGLGGATSTTSVDMSNTYLDWAERNLALNGLTGRAHELIQADVLKWLKASRGRRYGLIFLDPPTFSRSKRMEETLDVQRDHVELIHDSASLLDPDGILVFSTNLRRFRLDREGLADLTIEDITHRTIPEDFKRNPRIHQCFRVTRRAPV
jgi:23S rRNA (guanine2445-N2)-methyltransferase / 23S rRNA (guanine2069-N7)-methyltransferase